MKTTRRSFLASVAAILGLSSVKLKARPKPLNPLPACAHPISIIEFTRAGADLWAGQLVSFAADGKVHPAKAGETIVGIALVSGLAGRHVACAFIGGSHAQPR